VTNLQLFLAVGAPIILNTAVTLFVYTAINQRLTDLRDLWRAELHRVEEVLDARLKHLEERR